MLAISLTSQLLLCQGEHMPLGGTENTSEQVERYKPQTVLVHLPMTCVEFLVPSISLVCELVWAGILCMNRYEVLPVSQLSKPP